MKKQLIIPPGSNVPVRQVSGQLETEVLSRNNHEGVMSSSIKYLIYCVDFSRPFEGDQSYSYTIINNELFELQPNGYENDRGFSEPFFYHKNTRLRILGDDGFLKKDRITKVKNPIGINVRQFLKIIGECVQYVQGHPENLKLIESKS